MMSDPALYACPFCGHDEVELCRDTDKFCWISCAECGAEGPTLETRELAMAGWNKRQHTQQRATLVTDDESPDAGAPEDLADDFEDEDLFDNEEDEYDEDSDDY